MSAIYLHIPFCRRICAYCDFFRSARMEHLPQVVDAMMAELVEQRDFLRDKTIKTIYFGGGTPSLLSAEQVGAFLSRIEELYDTTQLEEVTLEANPDDLTREYLEALRAVGVNRLSIGVQSFDDEELRFMNRRHTSQQSRYVVQQAREVGFDNIAIDLIFGVQGFAQDVLHRSIDVALSLDVEHIAAYHLTIEPNTAFGRREQRGELSAVEESVSEREYKILHDRLTEAGYEHYEVSNYAKPARRSRHNSSYWQGVEYLGIGAGAHSYSGDRRRWAVDSIESYLKGGDERYGGEVLTKEDMQNEMLMTSLRCVEGLNLKIFKNIFGDDAYHGVKLRAQKWLDGGELRLSGDRIHIPDEHFMVSDMVIASLFVYIAR